MQQEAEGLVALAVHLMGEQFCLLRKERGREAVKAGAEALRC